jgi:hypothetical protein
MTIIRNIAEIAARTPQALLQDAIGMASLTVIFVVALHLPNLI